jgi:RimJ/RimL family protein N-acetyltransferase
MPDRSDRAYHARSRQTNPVGAWRAGTVSIFRAIAEVSVILETERLILRAWTDDPDDLARLWDMYTRPEVTRYLGAFRGPPDKAVDRWRERMTEDSRQVVAALQTRDSGLVVGTVLYNSLPGEHHMEVGWHLHPDSWGHGYATEAGRAVVERGFRLGVPEVFAVVRPENARSHAVCRRLGMRHLGLTRRYYGMELDLYHLAAPRRNGAGNWVAAQRRQDRS